MRHLAALLACLCALLPAAAGAQSRPEYVPLGRADSAVYRPDGGPAPHVAFLVIHRTSNFIRHIACAELSKRGYLVLCMNTRFDNNEGLVRFEDLALDVRAGMEYLRKQPGIAKVLLFGHSGGGPTVSFYQAVAENGPAYCKGPNKLVQCGDNLTGLPPADGIVFADSHPGNPENVLRGINPAVLDERNPPDGKIDPSLDPFDQRNGYNPNGPSHYSEAFRTRYYAAQSKRMNALIADAQAKLRRIAAGTYPYPDDDIVIIPRGGNPGAGPGAAAYLFVMDPSIPEFMTTARPEKLLRNDGSIVTQPIASVFVANPKLPQLHQTFDNGTKVLSLKSFLSANAVKSSNAYDGVDDCSSNNSTVCAVRSVAVPELFMAMGAHYFIRDVEHEYDNAAARDKDYVVVEGAVHGFTPCTACEKTPGQYGNSVRNLFDYVKRWVDARF